MKLKFISIIAVLCVMFFQSAFAETAAKDGSMSPQDALVFMKSTPDIFILDVREDEWYEGFKQFDGNVHIPYSELKSRYKELPKDRPIILNCGAGVMAPRAYKLLESTGIDMSHILYIAGTPKFDEYNQWRKKK